MWCSIFSYFYFNFPKDSWLSRFELTIRDTSIISLKAIIFLTLYTNSLKTNDMPQYLGHSPGILLGCGPLLGQHWLQTDIWGQGCPHLLTCSSLLCCSCYCIGIILSGRVVVKSTCLAHSLRWIKIPHLPFRMASFDRSTSRGWDIFLLCLLNFCSRSWIWWEAYGVFERIPS